MDELWKIIFRITLERLQNISNLLLKPVVKILHRSSLIALVQTAVYIVHELPKRNDEGPLFFALIHPSMSFCVYSYRFMNGRYFYTLNRHKMIKNMIFQKYKIFNCRYTNLELFKNNVYDTHLTIV